MLNKLTLISLILLLILLSCKNKDLRSGFTKEINKALNVKENNDVVKVSYNQPDLVFYLFKNEELAFLEFPLETFTNVNLDFSYNLSISQAIKEIHFFGNQKVEFLAFPATTEEVYAYELYRLEPKKLIYLGYYTPDNFDFNVNEFKSKELQIKNSNAENLLYLIGNNDTIICKKTSIENLTEPLTQELEDKIKNFQANNIDLKETDIPEKYIGNYIIDVETEQTTSGTASIQYQFLITQNNVVLKTNTFQEPISCNGNYKGLEHNNVLELYFTESESGCETNKPMFYLKEEGGEIYAKGLGGEATFHNWIELNRT